MEKKVAIVGAGISGLLACKYVLSKGLRPIVFEAQNSIGGVWTKTIKTTKLQTPKQVFQFYDFPWPSSVGDDFPDHHQVLDYIKAYANHFGLLRHIKFGTRVEGIEYEGPSDEEEMTEAWHLWSGTGEPFSSRAKWKVTVLDTRNSTADSAHHEVVYAVDFVILCVGRFSGVPNIPEFPPNKGPQVFHGKVLHSMEYASMDDESAAEFVKGKRVTVVGFQKSALDIAMECSDQNGTEHPCTVLYKTEHWTLPDFLPWGIPLALLYLNRFSELLIHKPGEGFLLSLLATLLSPMRWAFSKFVESHIKRKLRLEKYGMVPKHSFLQQISSCLITTVPEKFYDRVEEGSIILKKSPSFSFDKEEIMVDEDTTPLKTDLVILATGFKGDKKLRDMFVSPRFQELIAGSPDSAIPFYRWLAELLDGKFKLPSIKEMQKDAAKWDEHMKRYSGQYYRRSCIATSHIWYNDQLCKDMGWNHRRKKGFFAELFEPYGPLDYASSETKD